MFMLKGAVASVAAPILLVSSVIAVQATTITPVDPVVPTTAAALAAASLAASSGISITGGSEAYIGANGQGGTYSGFSLSNGTKTISNPDGVLLTSGVGAVPLTNTDTSFDNNSTGTPHPGTGSNAMLSAELVAHGMTSTTNDQNVLSFGFTVAPGITSVSASFVFGTDEYPDQGVTDIFGFFVDGVNYATFSDGSLISFQVGSASAAFYNNNNVGIANPFALEYDGITDQLSITGLLDLGLMSHELVLAIADTSDSIFDSGVFFAGLTAGTETGGGIKPPDVIPLPPSFILMLTGLAGLGAVARRHKKNTHKHDLA